MEMNALTSQCHNIPDEFNDQVSSFDSHGWALYLFEDRDCRGDSREFLGVGGPDKSDLNSVGFNDRASSASIPF